MLTLADGVSTDAQTITTGSGGSDLTLGHGNDTLSLGSGINQITLGAGTDSMTFQSPASVATALSSVTGAVAGDTIAFAGLTSGTGSVSSQAVTGTTLTQILNNAIADLGATVHEGLFTNGSNTYLVANHAASETGFTAGTDFAVNLGAGTFTGNEMNGVFRVTTPT